MNEPMCVFSAVFRFSIANPPPSSRGVPHAAHPTALRFAARTISNTPGAQGALRIPPFSGPQEMPLGPLACQPS